MIADIDLDFAEEPTPAKPESYVWEEERSKSAQIAVYRPPIKRDVVGRSMPHSIEAEEYLLSLCMLDGREVVRRCDVCGIGSSSFYLSGNAIVYEVLKSLYDKQAEVIDVSTVAEELKTTKQLDTVGGYAFLAQVSSRAPTTAQAGFYIEKVRELATLRAIIRQANAAVEDCYNYTGGIEEFAAQIQTRINSVTRGARSPSLAIARPLTSFGLPDQDDPAALLGRNRYIGRGDGAVLVSSSGMGKSVMSYEWPVLAALGRPFLGISTKRPLKSLLIQAEDSDGDIGEVMFSLEHMLKLTPDEINQVGKNVIVVREKVHRGREFVALLSLLVEKEKPDLVWLNPLHAFAGCDISDAKEMGDFLRGGLNGVNKDDRFAYMIVHHTPKPMTGKGVADKKWSEHMYDAAGSAELVNWARAVLTLKPTDKEGEFNLILAKRGKRAGVLLPAAGSVSGMHFEITTKIPIKHSSEKIQVAGRQEPFHVLHWETREADSVDQSAGKSGTGRPPKFAFTAYRAPLSHLCPNYDTRKKFGALHRAAMGVDGISESQFRNVLRKAVEDGELIKSDDGSYYSAIPGNGTEIGSLL